MAKEQTFWKTGICSIVPHRWILRGYDITDLMGRISYGTAIYLMFKGELPDPKIGRFMDAFLVSMCDFGPLAPSVAATRYAASGRSTIGAAMAAGLMGIGDAHGGAIAGAMEVFYKGMERVGNSGRSIDEVAEEVVKEFRSQRKYIPGYGLPSELGAEDPNPVVAARLYQLAKNAGVSGRYIELAEAIARTLKVGINLDGAGGAVMCELGFEPLQAIALFCLSRITGLACEAYEEMTREKPFRQTPYHDVSYDGPELRELPPDYRKELI